MMTLRKFVWRKFSLCLALGFSFETVAADNAETVPAPLHLRVLRSFDRKNSTVPSEFEALFESIATGALPKNIQLPNFSGSIRRRGSTLTFGVILLRLYGKKGGGFSGDKNKISHFNARYEALMGTLLSAFRERLRQDPSLEAVEIQAQCVHNKSLLNQLYRMNFQRKTSPFSVAALSLLGLALAGGAISYCEYQAHGMSDLFAMTMPPATTFLPLSFLSYAVAGHGDFKIRIPRHELIDDTRPQ